MIINVASQHVHALLTKLMTSRGLGEIRDAHDSQWDQMYGQSNMTSRSAPPHVLRAQASTHTYEDVAPPSLEYDVDEDADEEEVDEDVAADATESLRKTAANRMFSMRDVAMMLAAAAQHAPMASKPLTAAQRIRSAKVLVTVTWTAGNKPQIVPITAEMIMASTPDVDATKRLYVHKVVAEHTDTSAAFSHGMRLYAMNGNAPDEYARTTASADHIGYTMHVPRATSSEKERTLWVNSSDPDMVAKHGDTDYEQQIRSMQELPDKKNPGKTLPFVLVSVHEPLADLLYEKEKEVAHEKDGRLRVVSEDMPFYIVHKAKALAVVRRHKTETLDRIEMTKFFSKGDKNAATKGVRLALVRAEAPNGSASDEQAVNNANFGVIDDNSPGVSSAQLSQKHKPQKSEFLLRFDIVETLKDY